MNQTADALIIGGGIHGCSLAFHLAEKGIKSIVLEKNVIAAGATGRSSGLIRMHYDNRPEAELVWSSFPYFQNWEDRVGGDCGFTRTGFIQLVAPEFTDSLKKNILMHQDVGISTILITRDDVKRLAPSFSTGDIEAAAYEPESGYADANSTSLAFMTRAKDLGARIVQDCLVTGIISNDGKVSGVQTTQGDFSAPIIVNAAGPWADKIGAMVGIDIPLTSWQHDTMFVQRPKQIGPSHPTVIDNANEMYFRPETGGLTLVGLEDNNPLGEDPDKNTDHAKPGFVERAIDRIIKRVPIMEEGGLHSAHGGYDGLTPDQRAIISQAGPEGFYLVCGMSGTGFKIGPAVGASLSELIVDGASKTVDLTPFRFSRFEEGDLIKGQHDYGDMWH